MCMRREWLTLYQSVWLCVYTLPCGADIEIYIYFFFVLEVAALFWIQATLSLQISSKWQDISMCISNGLDKLQHTSSLSPVQIWCFFSWMYHKVHWVIHLVSFLLSKQIWTPDMHSFVPNFPLTDTVFPLVGRSTVLCVVSEKYQRSLFSFCLPPAVITVGHPK